jgi:hypothetical protein
VSKQRERERVESCRKLTGLPNTLGCRVRSNIGCVRVPLPSCRRLLASPLPLLRTDGDISMSSSFPRMLKSVPNRPNVGSRWQTALQPLCSRIRRPACNRLQARHRRAQLPPSRPWRPALLDTRSTVRASGTESPADSAAMQTLSPRSRASRPSSAPRRSTGAAQSESVCPGEGAEGADGDGC